MEEQLFILYCETLPLIQRVYRSEEHARREAEQIARSNRGAHVAVAKILGAVSEPLTPLAWSDGTPAGDGLSRGLNQVPLPRYDECNSGGSASKSTR